MSISVDQYATATTDIQQNSSSWITFMTTIKYRVGGRLLSEEEYKSEVGEPPNRMKSFGDVKQFNRTEFNPYFDHSIGKWCHSYADQERKVNRYNAEQKSLPDHMRNRQHPEGFDFANDDHKFMQECRYISKHGKEYREHGRKKSNGEAGGHIARRNHRSVIYSFGK